MINLYLFQAVNKYSFSQILLCFLGNPAVVTSIEATSRVRLSRSGKVRLEDQMSRSLHDVSRPVVPFHHDEDCSDPRIVMFQ